MGVTVTGWVAGGERRGRERGLAAPFSFPAPLRKVILLDSLGPFPLLSGASCSFPGDPGAPTLTLTCSGLGVIPPTLVQWAEPCPGQRGDSSTSALGSTCLRASTCLWALVTPGPSATTHGGRAQILPKQGTDQEGRAPRAATKSPLVCSTEKAAHAVSL